MELKDTVLFTPNKIDFVSSLQEISKVSGVKLCKKDYNELKNSSYPANTFMKIIMNKILTNLSYNKSKNQKLSKEDQELIEKVIKAIKKTLKVKHFKFYYENAANETTYMIESPKDIHSFKFDSKEELKEIEDRDSNFGLYVFLEN